MTILAVAHYVGIRSLMCCPLFAAHATVKPGCLLNPEGTVW